MEQHFIVAVKAIIPLFLLIGMGIFVRWRKMLTDTELKHVNAMIFRVFFFCMMFYNMYTTTIIYRCGAVYHADAVRCGGMHGGKG